MNPFYIGFGLLALGFILHHFLMPTKLDFNELQSSFNSLSGTEKLTLFTGVLSQIVGILILLKAFVMSTLLGSG